MNIKSLLAGALFALTLFATPAVVRADDPPVVAKADAKPVIIVRTYKDGETRRYSTQIKANVMGMEILITGGQKITVKELKKDGSVVLSTEAEEGKMEIGGNPPETQPATKPATITRDKFGKLVEVVPSEDQQTVWSPEIQKLIYSIGDVILNGKEVKQGESWETELSNPALKDKTFKVKTTFVGTDKVEEVEYLKVEQNVSVEVDADGAKMTVKTVQWLNPKDGSVFKAVTNVKNLPASIGSIDFDQTIKLAKPEEKKEKTDK